MENESRLTATMSIDTKRSRIRIHKAMLHQLGDPQYIQLWSIPTAWPLLYGAWTHRFLAMPSMRSAENGFVPIFLMRYTAVFL